MQEIVFKELLKESVTNQWKKFLYYRNLCKNQGKTLEDLKKAINNEEYYLIPGVVATAFKKSRGLVNELNDFSMIGKFQVSSSTSGDPSYVYTSDAQMSKILDAYKQGFGIEKIFNGIAFSPTQRILEGLSKQAKYMTIDTIARMKFAVDAAVRHYSKLHFTVKLNMPKTIFSMLFRRKPVFKKMSVNELTSIVRSAEKNNQMLGLGGIVLLLEPYLNQLADGAFNLNGNAVLVFSGGGYSGAKGSIRGNRIDKPGLIKKISSVFGIEKKYWQTNIKDIYSFTETPDIHEGYWNTDLDDFLFDAWPDSRVYIVNPETGKPLKQGRGLLKLISPYVDGNPSAANVTIIQMDSAEIRSIRDNHQVTQFSHISRVAGAGVEGCAYKAAEIAQT